MSFIFDSLTNLKKELDTFIFNLHLTTLKQRLGQIWSWGKKMANDNCKHFHRTCYCQKYLFDLSLSCDYTIRF